MEYWTNPKETYSQTVLPYPKETDPIVKSLHQGEHCLFYDPGVIKSRIDYKPTVQDQCDFMNSQDIWQDKYRVATVVKLNIFVADIKKQGIVKPVMLYYNGEEKFGINTGENRMRAIERIPSITHVESFISTHRKHADKFSHLPYIENFEPVLNYNSDINDYYYDRAGMKGALFRPMLEKKYELPKKSVSINYMKTIHDSQIYPANFYDVCSDL